MGGLISLHFSLVMCLSSHDRSFTSISGRFIFHSSQQSGSTGCLVCDVASAGTCTSRSPTPTVPTRYHVKSSCMHALWVLLVRAGVPSRLCIRVGTDEAGCEVDAVALYNNIVSCTAVCVACASSPVTVQRATTPVQLAMT